MSLKRADFRLTCNIWYSRMSNVHSDDGTFFIFIEGKETNRSDSMSRKRNDSQINNKVSENTNIVTGQIDVCLNLFGVYVMKIIQLVVNTNQIICISRKTHCQSRFESCDGSRAKRASEKTARNVTATVNVIYFRYGTHKTPEQSKNIHMRDAFILFSLLSAAAAAATALLSSSSSSSSLRFFF